MSKKPLTIIPVTLHPTINDKPSAASANAPSFCTVKLANAEITLQNGVEERIIQTIMRELINR